MRHMDTSMYLAWHKRKGEAASWMGNANSPHRLAFALASCSKGVSHQSITKQAVMTDLSTRCPKCGGYMTFPQELAGQQAPCPNCGESILLPKPKRAIVWLALAGLALITICLALVLPWHPPPKRAGAATNHMRVVTGWQLHLFLAAGADQSLELFRRVPLV